jgi:hypothetical protein
MEGINIGNSTFFILVYRRLGSIHESRRSYGTLSKETEQENKKRARS